MKILIKQFQILTGSKFQILYIAVVNYLLYNFFYKLPELIKTKYFCHLNNLFIKLTNFHYEYPRQT